MHEPTAFEQEMLELINRARLNPEGEFDALIVDASTQTGVTSDITNALRYFNVDLDMFRAQMAEFDSVAPLAWNGNLAIAADGHSQEVIDHDTQSHQLPGELSLSGRIVAAGYENWSTVGENVFAFTEDPVQGHAGFVIDWGPGPGGMQDPAGHRNSILSDQFNEVGISALSETDSSTSVGPWVVTQNFGDRFDYVPQLLGVVIRDTDGDDFYDAGEGLSGVNIAVLNDSGRIATQTQSWNSGGYQTELDAGQYTVIFWDGGLGGSVREDLTMGTENTKLDVSRSEAKSDNGVRLGTDGADSFSTGAGGDVQFGRAGNDTLTGASGNDILSGGAGEDLIRGGKNHDQIWGGSGQDTISGHSGRDTIEGGDGSDILRGNYGTDHVTGGKGKDNVWLGAGNDHFVDSSQSGAWGSDTVRGGAGDDTIEADGGYDILTGGEGADRFVFSDAPEADVITDYEVGVDTLALDKDLWGGGLSAWNVVNNYAEVTADGLLFDFGGGHEILLEGLTSRSGLAADMDLI